MNRFFRPFIAIDFHLSTFCRVPYRYTTAIHPLLILFVNAQEPIRCDHVGAPRYGQAKLEVRRNEELIRQAIADGYAVKTVWRQLQSHDLVTVRYESFRTQVRKLVIEVDMPSQRSSVPGSDKIGTSLDESNVDEKERMNRFMDKHR